MKFFVANILLVCCLFFANTSYSQLPQCCRTKKVKIKKGKKKRKGTLRGVKGYDDKKALKNKMKELKSASKARKKEKKAAEKEERVAAEEAEKEAKILAEETAAREEEEQELLDSPKAVISD